MILSSSFSLMIYLFNCVLVRILTFEHSPDPLNRVTQRAQERVQTDPDLHNLVLALR